MSSLSSILSAAAAATAAVSRLSHSFLHHHHHRHHHHYDLQHRHRSHHHYYYYHLHHYCFCCYDYVLGFVVVVVINITITFIIYHNHRISKLHIKRISNNPLMSQKIVHFDLSCTQRNKPALIERQTDGRVTCSRLSRESSHQSTPTPTNNKRKDFKVQRNGWERGEGGEGGRGGGSCNWLWAPHRPKLHPTKDKTIC